MNVPSHFGERRMEGAERGELNKCSLEGQGE